MQGRERLVPADLNPRQHLEHLVDVSQPAADGQRVGARADEEEIEERLPGVQGAGQGGGDGHRGLEPLALAGAGEGVEDQGVAREELVLVLADHRAADAGPAPPVDSPPRVSGAIVAERGELLGVSDRGGQRDPALLELPGARQPDRGHGVAAGEDEQRVRDRHPPEATDEPERIGPGDGQAGEAQETATERKSSTRTSATPPAGSGGSGCSATSAVRFRVSRVCHRA